MDAFLRNMMMIRDLPVLRLRLNGRYRSRMMIHSTMESRIKMADTLIDADAISAVRMIRR